EGRLRLRGLQRVERLRPGVEPSRVGRPHARHRTAPEVDRGVGDAPRPPPLPRPHPGPRDVRGLPPAGELPGDVRPPRHPLPGSRGGAPRGLEGASREALLRPLSLHAVRLRAAGAAGLRLAVTRAVDPGMSRRAALLGAGAALAAIAVLLSLDSLT